MPEYYRILEVSAYALLNFLPLAGLALYLFRNYLRFPKKNIALTLVILSFFQIGIGIRVAFFPGRLIGIISLLSTILYALFFLYTVNAPLGKSLFVLLLLSNVENYIVMSSKCLEGQLFPELAWQPYRWSFSVSMLLVCVILLPLFFLYLERVISPVIEIEHTSTDWSFLWLVPAVFYFIWYYCIYLITNETSLEMALNPRNTIIFTIFNLGALLVYFVVAKLLFTNEQNRLLKEKETYSSILLLQYQNLQEKILETRRARHDMRHHLAMISGYLNNKEYAKLKDYLEQYTPTIAETDSVHLCSNTTINMILLHFSRLAREQNIDFSVEGSISEQIRVSETDLSVLFGNLLENALDACAADSGSQKKIIVRIKESASSLFLTIDNTFDGNIKKTRGNIFLSTKHSGEGIGLDSCRSIANRYNGLMKIKEENHMFYASVLLNFQQA